MRMFQVKDDHGNSTLWYDTVAEARRAAFDQEMPITAEVREMCIGGKTDLIKTIKNFVNGDHTIEGFIKTTRNLGSVEQVKKAKVVYLEFPEKQNEGQTKTESGCKEDTSNGILGRRG